MKSLIEELETRVMYTTTDQYFIYAEVSSATRNPDNVLEGGVQTPVPNSPPGDGTASYAFYTTTDAGTTWTSRTWAWLRTHTFGSTEGVRVTLSDLAENTEAHVNITGLLTRSGTTDKITFQIEDDTGVGLAVNDVDTHYYVDNPGPPDTAHNEDGVISYDKIVNTRRPTHAQNNFYRVDMLPQLSTHPGFNPTQPGNVPFPAASWVFQNLYVDITKTVNVIHQEVTTVTTGNYDESGISDSSETTNLSGTFTSSNLAILHMAGISTASDDYVSTVISGVISGPYDDDNNPIVPDIDYFANARIIVGDEVDSFYGSAGLTSPYGDFGMQNQNGSFELVLDRTIRFSNNDYAIGIFFNSIDSIAAPKDSHWRLESVYVDTIVWGTPETEQ